MNTMYVMSTLYRLIVEHIVDFIHKRKWSLETDYSVVYDLL